MFYRIVDTHCHLNDENYKNEDVENIVKECTSNNVRVFVNVGVDLKMSKQNIRLSHKYDDMFSTIGIHPSMANSDYEKSFSKIQKYCEEIYGFKKFIGIGETGLDYYKDTSNETKVFQKKLFIEHIKLSIKYKLALVIHIRDAFSDVIDILDDFPDAFGIIHCFTGNLEYAKEFIKRNFYISFSGIITFSKTETIRNACKKISLNYILAETDSPYLSPHPLRGRKNYPYNIHYTLKQISDLHNIDKNDLIKIVYYNFLKAFRIKDY